MALCVDQEGNETAHNDEDEQLSEILKTNNLYDDLFEILTDNDIGLDILELVKPNEVDEFCVAYQITNFKIKLSFRRLMTFIHNKQSNNKQQTSAERKEEKYDIQHNSSDQSVDKELKQFLFENTLHIDLYQMFISQEIGYEQLATITPYDVDKLCDQNDVKIGTKIKLKAAIDKHQIKLIEAMFITKGNDEVIDDTKTEDVHLCICGHPLFKVMDGSTLYQNKGALCDRCAKSAKQGDIFWHCKQQKTDDHKEGFDICNICISKYKCIPPKRINIDDIQPDYNMKIVLAGDSAVGKTSLITKYVEGKFDDNVTVTVGIGFHFRRTLLSNNKVAELQIWDTAGQERYSPLTAGHYRNADVILLCYGCDNIRTFKSCEQEWLGQIEQYARNDAIVFIVGCKADQRHNRQLSESEGKKIIEKQEWRKYNAWWCECSAKTGYNIANVFGTASEMVMQQRKALQARGVYQRIPQFQQDLVNLNEKPRSSKKDCC